MTPPQPSPSPVDRVVADHLHSAAIRLLRRLRTEDDASGLSAPRASALSVLVFAGPMTLGELARAEQVQPPTISRLIREMEREDLVKVSVDQADRRVKRVAPTPKGRRLLVAARNRRVTRLARAVATLPKAEQTLLEVAGKALLELARIV
jgi:DNA-binding MarR family transcriptional regulator